MVIILFEHSTERTTLGDSFRVEDTVQGQFFIYELDIDSYSYVCLDLTFYGSFVDRT